MRVTKMASQLVTHLSWRTKESDIMFAEKFRKLRVLGSMAPACPHSLRAEEAIVKATTLVLSTTVGGSLDPWGGEGGRAAYLHRYPPCYVKDEVAVGIIVVVAASWDGNEVVSQSDVLCIRLQRREEV